MLESCRLSELAFLSHFLLVCKGSLDTGNDRDGSRNYPYLICYPFPIEGQILPNTKLHLANAYCLCCIRDTRFER